MTAKRVPPIAFAHRGARAHAPENTLEAFRLAVRLGATGLESDVWVTADSEPVLDHDGVVKVGLRKRAIRDLSRAQLPSHIPTLGELYDTCGVALELSLDLKDPDALGPVLATTRAAGGDAPDRLWLCDTEWERLASWRVEAHDVRLVLSTRMRALRTGPERRAADLRTAGIDAINMHQSDWTIGLTTLFHRFDRYAFGWDAQFERMLRALVAMEIDAVYCDDVEQMMSVIPPGPLAL